MGAENVLPKPPKVMFGIKEVLIIMGMVGGIGGSWLLNDYKVNAQEKTIDKFHDRVSAVEKDQGKASLQMLGMQKDVELISYKVGEIDKKQQSFIEDTGDRFEEQQTLLHEILSRVGNSNE